MSKMRNSDTAAIDRFIERWRPSGGSEMANFQSFAIEFTQLLGLEQPKVATENGQNNDYRFERPVLFTHTGKQSRGRIDLYRKGSFILEAKQGIARGGEPQRSTLTPVKLRGSSSHSARGTQAWDDTMLRARHQADGYARAVAKEDGWPPFLLVVDVGHVIEVYADFSKVGQGYNQFPDGNRYRIRLEDLHNVETRELLRAIWHDPFSLDPSIASAAVTRGIATHLADLGKSFENQGHGSEVVARFLMRCLFTMFAEDVDLIPRNSFKNKLIELRGHPEHAAPMLKSLWDTMNVGGFSSVLLTDLKRFNGGLFKNVEVLDLNVSQLDLLIEAANADWKKVEPAIFGTLLERALDKRQRHKLGAHYTPRSYVERLVIPAVIEPLRSDWKNVQTAVQRLMSDGRENDARLLVHEYHRKLCATRVLDPACGSGNFLYVALEMMKRLEGEVTALLEELGEEQGALALSGHTVDPHQFLGIEINPWAAAVAELVLWIGYLQWHFRTHGQASPSEPVLRDFKNIQNRDALLDWDDRVPRTDPSGNAVSRWDGVSYMPHPVTGEDVPDPNARIQVYDYVRPRTSLWPDADFVVGNPPFIGLRNIRKAYADGYLEALRDAYPDIPENADYVMYWWAKAAEAVRRWNPKSGKGLRRFGLITTNSITQTFNNAITSSYIDQPRKPLAIVFAVPDHPWVDSTDGASVRIAMTVVSQGNREGRLNVVKSEIPSEAESEGAKVEFEARGGRIHANLRIGVDVLSAKPLRANEGLASVGYQINGKGFLVDDTLRRKFISESSDASSLLKPWLNGMGIQRRREELFAIDAWPLSETQLRSRFPTIFQHLRDYVWPERSQNARKAVRDRWWLFEECRSTFRPALQDLDEVVLT